MAEQPTNFSQVESWVKCAVWFDQLIVDAGSRKKIFRDLEAGIVELKSAQEAFGLGQDLRRIQVQADEELTKTKASVKVKIPEGKSGETLVLFAHNTGDIGENTATIAINDGNGEELFELKSNLDTSQGITLILK